MTAFLFRKATYSNAKEECVEIATNVPHTVAVRDSKHPDGPVLRFTPAAWTAFLHALVRDPETGPDQRRGRAR